MSWLSFDRYGTLLDGERGILDVLRPAGVADRRSWNAAGAGRRGRSAGISTSSAKSEGTPSLNNFLVLRGRLGEAPLGWKTPGCGAAA